MTELVALVLAAGCQNAQPTSVPGAAVYVEDAKVESGGTVRVHAPAGSSLTVTPSGPAAKPTDETTWEVVADDGSYVVSVADSAGTTTKVYIDVGVKGPTGGAMEGLANLPPPPPARWPYYLVALLSGLCAAAVARYVRTRLKKPLPPPIPDPPYVIAQRAWAGLRERSDLDDETVARLMSEIFRSWLDATQPFPATKRTSREIVDNLASTLTAAELQSARRLLTATDLVKFADRSERANLFEQLDGDFSVLVRPGRSHHV